MTVDDVLQSVLQRMAGTKAAPGCTIIDAIRGVQAIIVNLLLLKRSDLIEQPLEIPFEATDSAVTLPGGYASMSQRPAVVGGNLLSPLNGPAYGDLLIAGEPRFYDVIGSSLSLFPPPAAELVVSMRAFVRPAVPALMGDDLPFQGAFDEVYAYGAHAVLLEGPAVLSDRAFAMLIESQVNGVLQAKSLSDEQMMADAINFPY